MVLVVWFARVAAIVKVVLVCAPPQDNSSVTINVSIPSLARHTAVLATMPVLRREAVKMVLVLATRVKVSVAGSA